MLRDLPHVRVERRGGRLTLGGWTSDAKDRKLLDRVLAGWPDALDLTTEDTGDPHRLLEVDATLFKVLGIDSQSAGHNFLERVTVNASVADGALSEFRAFGWMYEALIHYEVNIANASEQRVALLARPHLTTLSGTPATFLAGGSVVFKVSGTTSGDIKPYPFGTTLEVTPTLLRTRGEDGSPRVRLAVTAGRKTILPLENPDVEASKDAVVFDDVHVTSEAVLALDQTLILTGLNQREQRMGRSGVPGLKSIPIIKYLFSSKVTSTSDLAIIILLTPRDPAFRDEKNRLALAEFVEKRRAYIEAAQGTEEDMRRFKERYPAWYELAPNRFASHFFLMDNSEVYRRVNGMDLANEALNFDLLAKPPKKKENR
jgi:pilus assembly protein CpaC